MWRDRRVSQVRQSALQWVYVSFHVLKVAAEVGSYPTTPMIQLAVARSSATAGTNAYIRYFPAGSRRRLPGRPQAGVIPIAAVRRECRGVV